MKTESSQTRPKLTREQIAQRRLQPKSSRSQVENAPSESANDDLAGQASGARYAKSKSKFADSLRSKFGPEWIFDHPLINPAKIIEEALDRPMMAAHMCKQACVLLNASHHLRVHEYLVAAYCVALGFKNNNKQIAHLADEIIDGRSNKPLKVKVIDDNLLHYVFIYIFFQSGMVLRDRATQYAKSLKYYFDLDETPIEVERVLKKYGQNNLRKAAQRRDNIMQGAREWVQQGGDPTTVTMDEVLAAMKAEKSKGEGLVPEGESSDHSPRDIPPSELQVWPEIDGWPDADWLLENDPERNPNATGLDLDDEFVENELRNDENTQHPGVDEFFQDMMRITAQMTIGLSVISEDARRREAMLSLVRELWVKVMIFRGLLA